MSAGESQELLVWNVGEEAMLPSYEESRDIEWESWTPTVGWPVQVCMYMYVSMCIFMYV